MTHEAQMAEERSQKAMIDAARLADELRMEQETAMLYERDRKLLEAQKRILLPAMMMLKQMLSREVRG